MTRPNFRFNGYWDIFQDVKRPERDADQLPSYNAEVKNEWSYTSVPPICLNGVEKYTSLFYLFPQRIFPFTSPNFSAVFTVYFESFAGRRFDIGDFMWNK
jgi:hypothetical protein